MKQSQSISLSVILLCILIFGFHGQASSEKALRIGVNSADIGQLDPHMGASTSDNPIMDSIFSGLVRFRPGSVNIDYIEPDLAESWTASPDKRTWTFRLRKGVQFHGGFGELTSEDVVFSFNKAKDKNTSVWWSEYQEFDKVEATDRYTVKITLKNNIPTVLGVLVNYHGGFIVSKKAYEKFGKEFRLKPVGTGPFAFENYTPQQQVILKAHDQYFRGKPKLDRVIYRFMPVLKSRQMALQKEEVDAIEGAKEEWWVEEMKKYRDISVDIVPPGEMTGLHLNLTRKPLDNLKVRQAIAHSVNRKEIIEFFGPSVSEMAYSPVPPHYFGYTDDVPKYEYSTEKAKALLAEAGFPGGIDLGPVNISNIYQRIGELIQGQLQKGGIKMTLNLVDHPTYMKVIRKDENQVVFYGAARFPIADTFLTQFYHSASIVSKPTAVLNFSHYGEVIPGADDWIDRARIEPSSSKQIEYWAQAQQKIMRDLPAVPLRVIYLVFARKNYVDLGYKLESNISLHYQMTEKTDIRRP
jgi:peptide/nickel transport system substrate-binding protein